MNDKTNHYQQFETDFVPLLTGALDMFVAEGGENGMKDEHGAVRTDVDRIYQAEHRVKETRKRCRDIVDSAREDLRGELGSGQAPARAPAER